MIVSTMRLLFFPPLFGAVAMAIESYDYIVVGGGTAGITVATRLSQSLTNQTILLIEAGRAALDEEKINIPGLRGSALAGPYDWNFTMTPQEAVRGRTLPASRGKVLGGSSALNFMIWHRASAAEYDGWEGLGNEGWNWDAMAQAMAKSENLTSVASGLGEDTGDDGPLQACISRWVPEYHKLWVPTMENMGIKHNVESFDGQPLGAMHQPHSVDPSNYNRSYSANTYLPQAGPNLSTMLETRVAKVNLAHDEVTNEKVATGVTLQDGTVINARKEVILSAGSYQSPGLLELSGIGQKAVLDEAGIEQVLDLPGVGANYQDHIVLRAAFQLKPEYESADRLLYDADYKAEQLALWHDGKSSVYDYSIDGMAFLKWKDILGDDAALLAAAQQTVGNSSDPVLQKKMDFILDDTVAKVEYILVNAYGGTKGYPNQSSPLYGQDFTGLTTVLMQTFSQGSVHIKSSNVSDAPLITSNFLTNEYDRKAAIEALKYARRISQSEPLSRVIVDEYEPGVDAVNTDAEWEDYIRNTAMAPYHPVGTCAMLPREDGGVVDAQLRVWGTRNLRVVDASVMPVLVAAHIQSTVYGIGERGAALIIEDSKSV